MNHLVENLDTPLDVNFAFKKSVRSSEQSCAQRAILMLFGDKCIFHKYSLSSTPCGARAQKNFYMRPWL